MPSEKKWDAAAERDLCVAIFMATQEGRITYNWAKTHTIMSDRGYNFTKDAMSQHFTKVILKDYKTRVGGASAPSTPKTPRTPKRKTPSKSKALPSDDGEDDDDNGADLIKPAKKIKGELKEEYVPLMKQEQNDGDNSAAWLSQFVARELQRGQHTMQ